MFYEKQRIYWLAEGQLVSRTVLSEGGLCEIATSLSEPIWSVPSNDCFSKNWGSYKCIRKEGSLKVNYFSEVDWYKNVI